MTIKQNSFKKSVSYFLSSQKQKVKRFYLKNKVTFLYLEVTHRCNFKCITCYTKAGTEKPDALSLDEKKSVINQARKMGARTISLSGSGEPLLYSDIFTLIDFCKELGMHVIIFTNGSRIDRKTADYLIGRNVSIYFKIYSLKPDLFDAMTGIKNSYTWVDYTYAYEDITKTVRIPVGLKHLLEVQAQQKKDNLVRIDSVITRINAQSLHELARFSKENGLELSLETPVYAGHALTNYDAITPSSSEYKHLHDELNAILGTNSLGFFLDTPCSVRNNPVVWTNGDVGICSSRKASVGNVRNIPLKKLFKQAQKQKRKEDQASNSQVNTYFRSCSARRYYENLHGLRCNY